MPTWALGLVGPAIWTLLIAGAGLSLYGWAYHNGAAHERAVVARQVQAANARIRMADQRWLLKYGKDAAEREKALGETVDALKKAGGFDISGELLAKINRIKP